MGSPIEREVSIMPRKATSLVLKEGDYEYLRSLIKQRTIQAQVVTHTSHAKRTLKTA